MNIKQHLSDESYNWLNNRFNGKKVKDGMFFSCIHDYSWIKFFEDGSSAWSNGDIEKVMDFDTAQDCLDFLMIK